MMRSEDGLFAIILSVLSFFECAFQTRLHGSVKWNGFWTLFRAPIGSREDKQVSQCSYWWHRYGLRRCQQQHKVKVLQTIISHPIY